MMHRFSLPMLLLAVVMLVAASPGGCAETAANPAVSPSPSVTKAAGEKEAKEVYIPKDLDECFVELKKLLPEKTVDEMKNGAEKDMINYHHGLGTWLRNNWGLWKGSRLSKWFNDKGVQHPDDMSGIIFDSFWRHLNNKPIKLDEQIKPYQEYWKKAKEEREAREKEKTK
jgi:hypothetical protein